MMYQSSCNISNSLNSKFFKLYIFEVFYYYLKQLKILILKLIIFKMVLHTYICLYNIELFPKTICIPTKPPSPKKPHQTSKIPPPNHHKNSTKPLLNPYHIFTKNPTKLPPHFYHPPTIHSPPTGPQSQL